MKLEGWKSRGIGEDNESNGLRKGDGFDGFAGKPKMDQGRLKNSQIHIPRAKRHTPIVLLSLSVHPALVST